MSGVLNGVKNATGMPAISAARSIIYRPDSGLPFQLFFDTLNKDIYVDQSNGWELFTSGPGKYTFGSGLTNTSGTVTNNLTTGKSAGNIIFGFDDDLSGSGLQLWSAIETGINSNYILFGSWDDNGTAYFSNTGAWNFGAETDPSLTTPYLYVFQSRGVFNAQWDFNAAIKLLNTTGSHIQSVWQTSAPTGNANQTHLFFDSVGSPSFRIGTNYWFKFTPNTLTTNRNYILRDSNYTLAGTDIDNSFSVAQTFIAGSAATTSINFGTANTGIYGTSTNVNISIGGSIIGSFFNNGIRINQLNNLSNDNNSIIQLTANGSIISRNISDSQTILTVTQSNASATGLVQQWNNSSGIVAGLHGNGVLASKSLIAGTSDVSLIQPSAVLQANSTTRGFLPPRMSGLQGETISSPVDGLIIYCNNGNGTTINAVGFWGYKSGSWQLIK